MTYVYTIITFYENNDIRCNICISSHVKTYINHISFLFKLQDSLERQYLHVGSCKEYFKTPLSYLDKGLFNPH
jgi:hypothetical protein